MSGNMTLSTYVTGLSLEEHNMLDKQTTDEQAPAYEAVVKNKGLAMESPERSPFKIGSGTDLNILISFETEAWHARLRIGGHSIQGLMKSGIHLDPNNFFWKESCVIWKGQTDLTLAFGDWPVARVYFLKASKPSNEQRDRRPKSDLAVRAHHLRDLSTFRVSDLTNENCSEAVAFSNIGTVYLYDAVHPDRNFNALLDDRPLSGLWPWPKKR